MSYSEREIYCIWHKVYDGIEQNIIFYSVKALLSIVPHTDITVVGIFYIFYFPFVLSLVFVFTLTFICF